ncbi:NUDIX hydrolase [Gracilibacillus caseinilyticus]|uniref:NUDIX hydrolase n=1 Tax=Gracilibacillus caseinilyticus TaxID=2932256 RepID=A0ABY4ESM1_9BACI|nr:NUDIX hydrolase [Gracilibacillus caseinilyticus]UOQ46863.1 NUDIX hydrolase [Gracilibacillus caseinilyticus]
MRNWFGASGVCINEENKLLMVLQGKPEEVKKWSVPSGGLEEKESFAECCRREVSEETGFIVETGDKLQVKKGENKEIGITFEVHYFLVGIFGGERMMQDPDHLIYDIDWESIDELKELDLSFPEDRDFLIDCIERFRAGEGLHLRS